MEQSYLPSILCPDLAYFSFLSDYFKHLNQVAKLSHKHSFGVIPISRNVQRFPKSQFLKISKEQPLPPQKNVKDEEIVWL